MRQTCVYTDLDPWAVGVLPWSDSSKLEETFRLEAMISESIHNPTLLQPNGKKKYGRAARSVDSDESVRTEKDRKLLRGGESLAAGRRDLSHADRTNFWLHHVERDPILPYHAQESDPSSVRLVQEIMAAAGNATDEEEHKRASNIVRQLCRKASEACNEICQLQDRVGRYQKLIANPSKKRKRNVRAIDRVSVEWLNEKRLCSLIYTQRKKSSAAKDNQKAKPFVVKINSSSYHKLRSMFDIANKRQTKVPEADVITHAFHCLVFVLVVRYSALAGGQQINGDLRGGGNQGAVNSEVFGVLSKHFGEKNGTECFASPFNSTNPQFFSAFPSPDVDGFFGSCGDFYHPLCAKHFEKSGWFEANPPFCPGYETELTRRICGLLDTLSKAGKDSTFIVVVPTVRNGKNLVKSGSNLYGAHDDSFASAVHGAASGPFDMLIGHECCRSHIVLKAREHGYIEASQHLRPTQYKESLYR